MSSLSTTYLAERRLEDIVAQFIAGRVVNTPCNPALNLSVSWVQLRPVILMCQGVFFMVFNIFSFQRLVALERKTFKGHIQPWKWSLLLCGTGS